MSEPQIRVFLMSANAAHIAHVRDALGCVGKNAEGERAFRLETASRVDDALARLRHGGIDIVLLDHTPPAHQVTKALERLLTATPLTLVMQRQSAGRDEDITSYVVRNSAVVEAAVNVPADIGRLKEGLRIALQSTLGLAALRTREARFRAMSDASPLGVFMADTDGRCVYTNAAYENISGLTFEQSTGTRWSSLVHPQDRQRVLAAWRAAVHGNRPFLSEFRIQRRDGSVAWTRVNGAAMHDGARAHGHIQTVEDITARKETEFRLRAAEQALFDEKERAQVTLNSIGDAVISTDCMGKVTFMNKVAAAMTGWPCQEAIGRPLAEIFCVIDGTTRMPAQDPARRAIEDDRVVELAVGSVLLRRDGSEFYIEDSAAPIHNRDGRVTGAVIVFHDISQSQAMARRMAHLAHHDFLTGLPNRLLLIERISEGMALAVRHGRMFALVFIDLDNFKRINDSLGHAVGDELLRCVAERLGTCVRATDTVCRQGGDEFVILLSELEKPRDAVPVVEKLRAAVAAPYLMGGHDLHVTLSAGISVFPGDGTNADALLQKADTAMYHAKAGGRDGYLFYRPPMNAGAVRRLSVESGLRLALQRSELVLHYQPTIDLASGLITGSDSLVRWLGEDGVLTYPNQFVPVAEDAGLIVPIGQWVLREACRQTVAWIKAGLRAMPVAVNISALEFRHKEFLDGVDRILQDTRMAPSLLDLELTETVLMHDVDASMKVLGALKDMGITLAIDDFGTGFSSLAYLRRFPVTTLTIDQSFVRDITSDAGNASIVSAVIEMGRVLKQRVVAEGVETSRQVVLLKALQCAEGQGFHFSRPLPAAEFASLLRTTSGPVDMRVLR